MEQEHSQTSFLDLLIIWAGTIASHFTSYDLMVWATLVFTVLKTYILIRNEFFRKGGDEP
jgi:hypothetical protein